MVQIKVSKELAETLKWKSNNIDTERKYLLDALCETIVSMYQIDDVEATCNMREFFPSWHLADYKCLLDSLEKGFEIVE